MGEAEAKALAIASMKRPDSALLNLKNTVGASATIIMDPDTKAYMADLKAVLDWVEHLEKASGETPVTMN